MPAAAGGDGAHEKQKLLPIDMHVCSIAPVERIQAIRLKPAHPEVVLDTYDLDAVALEFDGATGRLTDFRLELGRGYFIVWALPLARGGRLRAILVDCAVAEIETCVEHDPFALDYGPEFWCGELGRVGPGEEHVLESVCVVSSASPPPYRCEARIRQPDGSVTHEVVASA